MIFGNNRVATIIVASNLPGYDIFLTDDFTKSFSESEPIRILYPPDHPKAGQYFVQNFTQFTNDETIFGVVVAEIQRITYIREENTNITVNLDAILPYQTELNIAQFVTTQTGLRPITDADDETDAGVDAFLLEGSIIVGVYTGAKRYYAGPFKGFTKENESVCEDPVEINLMDGSDCKGWKKGSYYESGYIPSMYDVFSYAGQPAMRVDPNAPFNTEFMKSTPFAGLNYTWLNVRNRRERPIPYSMTSPQGKGVSAVAISQKHAIVLNSVDIDSNYLKFYSDSVGIVTRSISSSINTFKQMWDAIGFVDENRDAVTLASFNELKKYFEGIKIITLNTQLPSDIVPIQLLDIASSDSIFWAMAIGQEARGHCGIFCPPLSKSSFDIGTAPKLLFTSEVNNCTTTANKTSKELADTAKTLSVVTGDEGSPVVTYQQNKNVLVGLVSEASQEDPTITSFFQVPNTSHTSIAKIIGIGMGSSKKYKMGWGYSFSPNEILNLYLAI